MGEATEKPLIFFHRRRCFNYMVRRRSRILHAAAVHYMDDSSVFFLRRFSPFLLLYLSTLVGSSITESGYIYNNNRKKRKTIFH